MGSGSSIHSAWIFCPVSPQLELLLLAEPPWVPGGSLSLSLVFLLLLYVPPILFSMYVSQSSYYYLQARILTRHIVDAQ